MMNNYYDEINLLVNDITEGKVNRDAVENKIADLKGKYGDDIFPRIQFQKKSKPWDKEYFAKLKKMNITGACSEEFLIHMAEVSEYITSQKKKKAIGITIVGIVVLIIVICIFIL